MAQYNYNRRPIRATLGKPQPAFPKEVRPTIKNPDGPATEKARVFLKSLAKDREVGMPYEACMAMFSAWEEAGVLTAGFVSDLIEEYKAHPYRADTAYVERAMTALDGVERTRATVERTRATAETIPPGYYATGTGKDREFWVVVENLSKTGTYAKLLMKDPPNSQKKWGWVYVKGAVYRFKGQTPLTTEEAGEWGRLHEHCMICGLRLEDPKSVERGIGPTCFKNLKEGKVKGK